MKRDERWAGVHAAVSGRVPADEREIEARARFLADLERLPFPFSEDADPTHVTASAIVVVFGQRCQQLSSSGTRLTNEFR